MGIWIFARGLGQHCAARAAAHSGEQPAPGPLPYAFQWRRDNLRPLVPLLRELALQTADFSGASQLF